MLPDIVMHMFGKEYKSITIDEDEYNLIDLFMDVKILALGVWLMRGERVFVNVRLPWTSDETITLQSDEDLIKTFNLFKSSELDCIHLNLEWLLLVMELP